MPTPFARWTLSTSIAMGSAACGVILGDAPEGRIIEVDAEAGTPGPPAQPEICTITNGVILDMAMDANEIFWLQASPSGETDFALRSCPKSGGEVRHIATIPTRPDALTLSDQYVFWSINQDAAHQGGVWRADKQGRERPTTQFTKREYAGPIIISNGILITSTHKGGYIFYDSPETGEVHGSYTSTGDTVSLATSSSTLYWSMQDNRGIATIPTQRGFWVADIFANGFPAPPTGLSFDDGILYWATLTNTRATISSKCIKECQAREIVTPPAGLAAFAIRGGHLYWTANEGQTGVVRACTNLASPCEPNEPPFWSHAGDTLSRIALDDASVYFATRRGSDTYIVKLRRQDVR